MENDIKRIETSDVKRAKKNVYARTDASLKKLLAQREMRMQALMEEREWELCKKDMELSLWKPLKTSVFRGNYAHYI